MQNPRSESRTHILFPTPTEAVKSPGEIYSDHLLILGHAAFGGNKASLNILSLNVLNPGSPMCGFYARREWETEAAAMHRYTKIAKGLACAVEKHQADIIALQEVTPKFLVPLLKAKLPKGWRILEDETIGLLTCVNTERFNLESPDDLSLDTKSRIRSLKLRDLKDNKFVRIHNIWGLYDPIPVSMEQCIRSLLSQDENAVIIGDTNSRIAPIDNMPRNITTGVIPLLINRSDRIPENIQRPDYPDGGFYRGADGIIHQLPIQALHYESGEIVEDTRSVDEVRPWPEFRMVLCLDAYYLQARIIANKNIFEYQDYLRDELHESVIVRMAADCFNRKAIGMRFMPNSNLCKYIVSAMSKEPGVQQRFVPEANDTGRIYTVIFVPQPLADKLNRIISRYQKEMNAPKPGNQLNP